MPSQEILPGVPAPGVYAKDSLSYEGIMTAVIKAAEDAEGAIATYVGRVKSPGFAGRKVVRFLIGTEHGYTDDAFRRICGDVRKKFGLQLALIYHYEGEFRVGEILVIIIVVGKARPETFGALQELVSRFKPEGHLRKKEIYEHGESEWIEK